jgi:hypothetical protein
VTAAMRDDVAIRDRRELPFFQVRLQAIRAIREAAAGPRRLRTIGFYALLCQLANEQRHTGEHRVLRAGYDALTARGGVGRQSVKLLLDNTVRARVVRQERLNVPEKGATATELHLLIHEGSWTPVTVATAEHLAQPRAGGHLLRDLGMVVVLLELCCEQRERYGGTSASTSRREIAERAGLTVDRVDDRIRGLEAAGVLTVDRHRGANGGRHLPSTYTVHEARRVVGQGGVSELAGRRLGTGRAAFGNWQGGVWELAGRRLGTGKAADWKWQGGNSAITGSDSRPSITPAGASAVETAVEEPFPNGFSERRGGGEVSDPSAELCEALVRAWAPALGDGPRQAYQRDRDRWLMAARELLGRHPRERLQRALEYMLTDEILASRALTLPDFAKIADQLLARSYARAHRATATGLAGTGEGVGWTEARQLLERAVRRYGRDHRSGALEELTAVDMRFVIFVDRVGWTTLCDEPVRYSEARYSQLWSDLRHKPRTAHREDAV